MPIDKDELNEFIKTEEGKEFFGGLLNNYVAEKGYKTPEDIKGLVSKKEELEKKIARVNRDQTSEEQQKILKFLLENDMDDLEELENVITSKKQEGKQKDDVSLKIKRLEKQLETIQSDKQKAEELYKLEKTKRIGTVKENAITKALKKVNAKDNAFDFLYDYFEKRAEIEELEDDRIQIVAKDKEGLRPSLDKYIEDWSKTESATDFLNKPVNKGAGFNGSGSGDSKSRTKFSRDELGKNPELRKEVLHRSKTENIEITD